LEPSNINWNRSSKNEVLNAKQLFKHKKLKKFKIDGVLACVPATRMMIYEQQRMFFGSSVDLEDLAPDCIGQILYEILKKKSTESLPESMSKSTMSENVARLKHRADWCQFTKPNLYREPDPDFTTTPEGDSNQLLALLICMLKSRGGLVNYTKQLALSRPDLTGAVLKTYKYEVYPGQNNSAKKGKVCWCCGAPNLFMQADQPYKPLRSKNPGMPLHEVSDDSFEYEEHTWEEVDGAWINTTNIAWRCGLCMADLTYKPIIVFDFVNIDTYFTAAAFVIGGLLEQLKLTRVGDFFSEASSDQKESIIEHDMNIVK